MYSIFVAVLFAIRISSNPKYLYLTSRWFKNRFTIPMWIFNHHFLVQALTWKNV